MRVAVEHRYTVTLRESIYNHTCLRPVTVYRRDREIRHLVGGKDLRSDTSLARLFLPFLLSMDQYVHQACQQLEEQIAFAAELHERAERDKEQLSLLIEAAQAVTGAAQAATDAAREAIDELKAMDRKKQYQCIASRKRIYADPAMMMSDVKHGAVQAVVLR